MFQDHATYDVNRNGRLDSEGWKPSRQAAGKLSCPNVPANVRPPRSALGGPFDQDLARQWMPIETAWMKLVESCSLGIEKLRAGHSKDGQR
jgi:hypothetical protein